MKYQFNLQCTLVYLITFEEKYIAIYEIYIHTLKSLLKVLDQISSGYIPVSFISHLQLKQMLNQVAESA